MSLALCSSWLSQAQDARHHGRHGPQDSYVEVHRCSSWTRSFTCPLVCYEWRHGPDSAENCLAIPQVLLIIKVIYIPVAVLSYIPVVPCVQRAQPSTLTLGASMPCGASRVAEQGSIEFASVKLWRRCRRRRCSSSMEV